MCISDISTVSGRLVLNARFGTYPLAVAGCVTTKAVLPGRGRLRAALTLQDMTAETYNARQSSEWMDLRNLIETIPALVVCALPDGFAEFANHACQEYAGCSSSAYGGFAIGVDRTRISCGAWGCH